MNVLLLSMPDSFEHMPAVAIRMPNGALSSLAGNVDPHHRVAVADLVLVQDRVRDVVATSPAEGLVSFARAEKATQLVLGASRRGRLQDMLRGSFSGRVIRSAQGIDVHVIEAFSWQDRETIDGITPGYAGLDAGGCYRANQPWHRRFDLS